MVSFGIREPWLNLPDTEEAKAHGETLRANLSALVRQVDAAYTAYTLFEFAQSLQRKDRFLDQGEDHWMHSGWKKIAARETALRISDFAEALKGCDGALRKVFGAEVVNHSPSAGSLFQAYFPESAKARHSAAHTALKTKNATQRDTHSFSGSMMRGSMALSNVRGMIATDILDGTHYGGTWDGEFSLVDVGPRAIEHLEEIKIAQFKKIPEKYVARR